MSDTVIYRKIPRVDPALIESLRGIPVADLHDEMSAVDRKTRLMHHTMRPVVPELSFVGTAVTAFNSPGDNLMMHAALYYAEQGDVLVVSNGGEVNGSLWGGNAAIQAQRSGVQALVADGPIRDVAQIRELRFPVYATSISVTRPMKQAPGTVNVPIECAGVLVRPGDVVVGDADGVIVIAPFEIERIVTAARARIKRDEAMHVAIKAGSTLFEQLGGPATLHKLGAVIEDGPWTEQRDR